MFQIRRRRRRDFTFTSYFQKRFARFFGSLCWIFREGFCDQESGNLESFAHVKKWTKPLDQYDISVYLFKLFSINGYVFGDVRSEESSLHSIKSVSGRYRDNSLFACNRSLCEHDLFNDDNDFEIFFSLEIREKKGVETVFDLMFHQVKNEIPVASVLVLRLVVV